MQEAGDHQNGILTGPVSPALSIVVIGRNEGERLRACLESIRRVKGVQVKELIYVDSNSTDGSPELASQYGAETIVVRPERPTAAIGRNAGWRRATSDLILFLDGDTILHEEFPLVAWRAISAKPAVVAVWGHRREIHPEESTFNRVLDLDWIYPPGPAEFCGGDVLMRRGGLEETGGFDEGLIAGEEPELCRRLRNRGYEILHIDAPMTGHDLQILRWSQYWKRATRAGHAYAEVSERFEKTADPFWMEDRKRNILRGSWWVVSLVVALAGCIIYGALPLVLWICMLLALSARSAWKARWKGAKAGVLFLYGLHSHLQQIPILVGQVQYQLGKRRNQSRTLIEYKDSVQRP